MSTLRFGIRAKSIKNTARVNAELSPAELKNLLKKSQAANGSFQTYIAALEAELAIWRSGGQVAQGDWATPDKAQSPAAAPAGKRPVSTAPSTPGRSGTPLNPALDNLRGEFDSRPQTPTVIGLDKDEREDFLRRENELTDLLAERVRSLGKEGECHKLTHSIGSGTKAAPKACGGTERRIKFPQGTRS